MRGKKGVCAFFWMVYLESDIMFFFFLLHSWIKNFRRNADVVYFHRPPVCLCKKNQKKPHNIPPPTQHTRIHNTYTHSTIDARIFFRSRARRSGARSVACTPLSLPPWLAFDVLPRMSSGVKERVFFFLRAPQTHTQTHISTHLAYEQDNLLSLTHPHHYLEPPHLPNPNPKTEYVPVSTAIW